MSSPSDRLTGYTEVTSLSELERGMRTFMRVEKLPQERLNALLTELKDLENDWRKQADKNSTPEEARGILLAVTDLRNLLYAYSR